MKGALAVVGLCAVAALASCTTTTTTEAVDVADPVDAVVVDVPSGRIDVVGGSRVTVGQRRVLRSRRGKPEVRQVIEGRTLRLTVVCPRGPLTSCSVDLLLAVPSRLDVNVRTGSGDVSLDSVAGRTEAKTGSGVVTLRGLSGPATAETGSGDVDAGGLRGATFAATTGSGAIRAHLTALPESVSLKTGSGAITVDVPRGVYRIETRTGSGSVQVSDVTDDSSSSRVIRAEAGSGAITITGSGATGR